jgi:hypothetical protein
MHYREKRGSYVDSYAPKRFARPGFLRAQVGTLAGRSVSLAAGRLFGGVHFAGDIQRQADRQGIVAERLDGR